MPSKGHADRGKNTQGPRTKVLGSGTVPIGDDSERRQEGQAGSGGWKVEDSPGRENTQGKRQSSEKQGPFSDLLDSQVQ